MRRKSTGLHKTNTNVKNEYQITSDQQHKRRFQILKQ